MAQGLIAVEIVYCASCNYLPLAMRVAESLLSAFPARLAGVTLVPGDDQVFDVRADAETLFSKGRDDRLPRTDEIRLALGRLILAARESG